MKNGNILIVGVGGQGTLLASRILGAALIAEGFDVKLSEVHGMSQRGGSVVTYVRYGDKVASPIIEAGGADLILAFEQLEAYRYLPYLKPEGRIILNTQKIAPMPVITGAAAYPEKIVEKLSGKVAVTALDALALAREAGTEKAVNVVLIGVMAAKFDFDRAVWEKALESCVPPKFLDMNRRAFALGWQAGKEN